MVDVANDEIKYSCKQGLCIVYDSKCMGCQGESQENVRNISRVIYHTPATFGLCFHRYWETNLWKLISHKKYSARTTLLEC